MADQLEIDELKAKNLCYHCVGEAYLRAEIRREGLRLECSYCDHLDKSYTIGDMAERIDEVFAQHYRRTSDQPSSWQQSLLSDRESDYDWERDGEPVVWAIANAADIPEDAAQDIQALLDDKYADWEAASMGEETAFSDESYYEEKAASDEVWQEEWRYFERSLKTEARFFSRTAAAHLATVFSGIETMSTSDGRPLVVDAGPGTALNAIYRARAFQSDDRLVTALCRPDQHLGSPPASQAISVFYGSNDPGVAIAEVRPPVGSQVAVARFEVIRPLRLLDLTALGNVREGGSVFDSGLASRMERAIFLRSLSQRITRPVMPDDEVFEYLPTQAIADFLATENDPPVDGIIFPSIQVAGDVLNVVLFHKAARIEAIDLPKGTEIDARTGQTYEEGWEVEYSVTEHVPPAPTPDSEKTDDSDNLPILAMIAHGPQTPYDNDSRGITLRIDLDSIKVHVVQRVDIDTVEHDVRRRRLEKRNWEY
jgi:hypothetical protein